MRGIHAKNLFANTGDHTTLTIRRRNGDEYRVRISTSDREAVQRRQWRIVTSNTSPAVHVGSGTGENAVMLARYLLDPTEEQVVSHHNGDGLDCRRENLFVTDRAEVSRRTTPTRSASGERHIYPDPHGFNVRVTVAGERLHIAYCHTLAGAIELRDAWLADNQQVKTTMIGRR